MILSLRTSIGCLLCVFGSLLSAQSPEEDVRGLFSHNGNIEWVRNLNGTINNMHAVHMTLAHDGSAYRGFIAYDGIEDAFELQGAAREGTLTMQELDNEGNVTGIIKGKLQRDRFNGAWWSADMTRSAEISLLDEGLILLEEFDPGFYVIEGQAGDEKIDIALAVESPLVISGTWQRNEECVRLFGECGDFLCDEMRLVVQDGDFTGKVITLSERKNGYRIEFNGFGPPVQADVQIKSRWPLRIHSRAGYTFLADMAYPAIDEGAFDQWLSDRLDKWYDAALTLMSSDQERVASSRWSKSASAWVDVFMIEDNLVTGMITYLNAKEGRYSRETFIYDMRNGQEMSLSELEKRPGALLKKLQSLVEPGQGKSEDFKYVILSESGFVLCSDFDSILGDKLICIPFDNIEDVVRKRSLFAKLED